MSSPLTVKSKNIKPFIQFISNELDSHARRAQSTAGDMKEPSWKPTWSQLKSKGFKTANSRTRLAAILGLSTTKAKASQKTFSGVIELLRKEMPVLDSIIDFTANPNDPDVWTLTRKEITPSYDDASPPTSLPSSVLSGETTPPVPPNKVSDSGGNDWTTVPGTFDSPLLSRSSTKSKNEDSSSNKMNLNKFGKLTQEDEFHSELIQLEAKMQRESANLIDDEEVFDEEKNNEEHHEGTISGNDLSKKNKKEENKKEKSNQITEIETSIIENAIENDTVGSLDINTLTRWILSVTRKDEFDIAIHDGLKMINKESYLEKHKLEHENKIAYTTNEEKLDKHSHTIIKNIDNAANAALKPFEEMEQKSSKIKSYLNEKVMTAKKELNRTETSAIMAINECGNVHIHNMKESQDQCNNTINIMRAEKSISLTSIQDIRRLNKHLEEKILHQYENFQEKIAEMADDEKDNLREWMDIRSNFIQQEVNLINDLKQEKERIYAERILMKEERVNLEKLMKEILNKQNEILSQQMYQNHDPQDQGKNDTHEGISQHQGDSIDEKPPLSHGAHVTYSTKVHDSIPATVLHDVQPYYDQEIKCWIYRLLFTNIQQIRDGCKGIHITPVIHDEEFGPHNDKPSTFQQNYNAVSSPAIPILPSFQPNDNISSPQMRYHHQHHSSPHRRHNHYSSPASEHGRQHSERQLGQHEFEYPIGTVPQHVNTTSLLKYGSKWTFQLRRASDLRRGFYERIKGNAMSYGIYLRAFEDITLEEGVEAITPNNCRNYSNAYKAMNGALFQFLDVNKKEIFNEYTEPLGYFEAFARKNDGFGFLKRVMKKRHPKLRDIHDRSINTGHRPKYLGNLFEFVDDNIEWLHDEKIRGRSNYSDKENINYIINALEDDRYDTARNKIETILEGVNNKEQPKPFPEYLKLHDDSDLGLAVLDMLKEEDKTSLMQDFITTSNSSGATINKVQTRSSSYSKIPQRNKFPNKNDGYKIKNDGYKFKNDGYKNRRNEWAPELQWERLEGATCPACGKSNHNVYRTGCPSLAVYCACKEFYDKTDKDKLVPVQKSFQKYQKELRHKIRARKSTDKMYLRRMSMEYDTEDMAKLKRTFAQQFTDDLQQTYNDLTSCEDLDPVIGPDMYDDLDDSRDIIDDTTSSTDDDNASHQ